MCLFLFNFQIVCMRNESAGPETIRAIKMLLQGKFYVPVIRSIDNSAPPYVGEPFTESQVPDVSHPFSPQIIFDHCQSQVN